MQRFFVPFPLSIDVVLTDADIIHQFTRVLRFQIGDHVILFDGDGSETEYEIVAIEKKSISLKGIARTFPKTEATKSVTLYQALPNKIEKIEYILQKWVEIGIKKFIFFRSDRSQKLVLSDSKIARFHAIAREAVEQCGGLVLPEIHFLEKKGTLPESWIHMVLDTLWEQKKLREFSDIQDIGLWVGPEWGWSEEERQEMIWSGFIFAHFSERVMRTETAGVVVAFSLLNQ